VYPEFRRALTAVPEGRPSAAGSDPAAYGGNPVAASLAAVRIAALDGVVELRGDAARAVEASERSARSLLRTADVRVEGACDEVDAADPSDRDHDEGRDGRGARPDG